ncbi:MAG: FKBP-type peptidyl-prolyl cis-trans isomerase [Bacteroides sp.]|jgi:FKBP-type peptidyl-prolyl cis-trans isomerase|nr:FKBP-type peptidyl-prolyl cis-trans isomerase [Bacteroides sp.]
MRILTGFFVVLILWFAACQRTGEEQKVPDSEQIRETLEETNKILLESEKQEIKDFIARYGWEMQETGTGLWYQVYKAGDGEKAKEGNIALIHYSIHLLTGDLVYSSATDGAKEFKIGRGGVESGLEEGILFLREGDKARFIMPSHLAHGVPGDGVKIPSRATIVYDVELIEIK